jgi:hypothetical protein
MNTTQHSETGQNGPMCATNPTMAKQRAYSQMLNSARLTLAVIFCHLEAKSKIRRVAIKRNDSTCPGRSKHKTSAARYNRCNYELDYTATLRPQQPLPRIRGCRTKRAQGSPIKRQDNSYEQHSEHRTRRTAEGKLREKKNEGEEGRLTGGRRG